MAFQYSAAVADPMADINVTPLVDVMLVLLIIFMITAPMLSHKIKIDLAATDTATARAADLRRPSRSACACRRPERCSGTTRR